MNLENERILIGLSGGINSMAVLCHLVESGVKPAEVHLFYAHFTEHSPDTFQFVADGIRYARKHFPVVKVKIEKNSVLKFFENENMIPHPANSPCSKRLKIDRINEYAFEHDLKIDLVGYVKHELKKRAGRQQKTLQKIEVKNGAVDMFALQKLYTIGEFTDEWCFEITERNIGWYPKIYTLKWNDPGFVEWLTNIRSYGGIPDNVWSDIESRIGTDQRVFKHNNCLPCKNMYSYEILAVQWFYGEYHWNSMMTSQRIKRYWGRDEAEFYATFGRDLGQESTCEVCKF